MEFSWSAPYPLAIESVKYVVALSPSISPSVALNVAPLAERVRIVVAVSPERSRCSLSASAAQ